jgi:hypothetical protein
MEFKGLIKSHSPEWMLKVHKRYNVWKSHQQRKANAKLSTKAVFDDIYANNKWGGQRGEFCSGGGSAPEITSSYINIVNAYITRHANDIQTVVDIGCGDFRVGSQLQLKPNMRYIGVDIVESLISFLNKTFSAPSRSFLCRDVIVDDIPNGELCLIRQVLQHLSNQQIIAILEKIKAFRYVLVTEHHPSPAVLRRKNIDKPHGADTRVLDDSGVYIEAKPFGIIQSSVVLRVKAAPILKQEGEEIVTYLIESDLNCC